MPVHADNAVDPSNALPVVFRILDKWQCTTNEQMTLLGVSSRSTLNEYRGSNGGISLTADTKERMSCILSIHESLHLLFTADDSIYGWVRKPNNHPAFAGRSAMDIMNGGRVAGLHEVSDHLRAWSRGSP
jgi:hypothetical protein